MSSTTPTPYGRRVLPGPTKSTEILDRLMFDLLGGSNNPAWMHIFQHNGITTAHDLVTEDPSVIINDWEYQPLDDVGTSKLQSRRSPKKSGPSAIQTPPRQSSDPDIDTSVQVVTPPSRTPRNDYVLSTTTRRIPVSLARNIIFLIDAAKELARSCNVPCLLTADEWELLDATYFQQHKEKHGPFSGISPHASRVTASLAPQFTASSSNAVDVFKKGIRRQPDSFPALKDDNQFQRWAISMLTQARAQGVENILDSGYVPTTSDERALFSEQQKYMMSVLDSTVRTDRGKDIIREYLLSGDAQAAYAALYDAGTTSTAAKLNSGEIRRYLTTKQLDSTWRGTQEGFILSWRSKLRQYEDMVDPQEYLPDKVKKDLLQNAVSTQPNLLRTHNIEQTLIASGQREMSFDKYLITLTAEAVVFDKGHPKSLRRSANISERSYVDSGDVFWDAPSTERSAHVSDHGPNTATGNNRPRNGRTPPLFLRPEQWKTLTADEQESLRSIRKRLLEAEHSNAVRYAKACELALHSTQLSSTSGESTTDTTTEPESPAVTEPHSGDDSFLSMYQAGHVPHPDVLADLLANTHMFEYPSDRQVNVTFRVSSHEVETHRVGALVDRGANGCLCGKDMVHTDILPGRFVDITGLKGAKMDRIPIGTGIGLVQSTTGKTLIVIPQAALSNDIEHSILSPIQMEMYGNDVDDRSRVTKGQQRIKTTDGYRYGLHIRNGLPYLDVRKPTQAELDDDTIPTVFLTSPFDWDPSAADSAYIDGDPEAPIGPNNPFGLFWDHAWLNPTRPDEYHPHDFDPVGRYNPAKSMQLSANQVLSDPFDHDDPISHLETSWAIPWAVNHTEVSWIGTPEPRSHFDEILDRFEMRVVNTQAQQSSPPIDYTTLSPLLCFSSNDVIEHTLKNTTRFARLDTRIPMRKHFKSRYPALNVRRRNEPVSTDTIFSDVPAIDDGSKAAQYFQGKLTKVRDVYGVKTDAQFVATLEDNIRQRGAMDQLISDRAQAEISNKTKDILRSYAIQDRQSEPHHQHQNPAERGILDVKNKVNLILDRTGAPAFLWLLCLQYVCLVLNCIAHRSLGWRTPLQVLTGSKPDISAILCFTFYEPVFYSTTESLSPTGHPNWPSATKEELGFFVGIADNVGDALTFKVLTKDTHKILYRSAVRSALDVASANARAALFSEPGEGDSVPEVLKLAQLHGPQDSCDDPHSFDPDDIIGRTFLMPVDDNGHRQRVRIAERFETHQNQGIPIHHDPNSIKYLIDLGTRGQELMAYADVIDHINSNIEEGLEDDIWRYEKVIAHHGPYKPTDDEYKGSAWNVTVVLPDGSQDTLPLSLASADDPIPCALYAQEHRLLGQPGWKRFKQILRRQKKLTRQINAARRRSYNRATVFKYGYEVPSDYKRAMEIDDAAGNTKWGDALNLELEQVCNEYKTFKDLGKGAKPPPDYKKITAHVIWDVKHDGRHKARLVAGGHLTTPPKDAVYSGVVSIRSIRIITFLSELNSLSLWAADVGNAYLESYTKEKVYIVGGADFKPMGLEGHTLLIDRALYGLRSSGARWNERFADILRSEGWTKSKADGEVWFRANKDVYEYIAVYVDDLLIAMLQPESFVKTLREKYSLKLKGVGPLTFHLGCDFIRDPDGTLGSGPHKYITKMEATFKRLFPNDPLPKVTSPLEPNDHPELDTSSDLTPDDIEKYYTMIGELQWLVTLGRIDIFSAVTTMGRFRVEPHEGHLRRLQRIYGYVIKTKDHRIRYRTGTPDYLSKLTTETYDWSYSVYGNVTESVPVDIPPPLGKAVYTITFVDANLYHCQTTGRALTGILHFLNGTPTDWFSKRQATVETATYGSEFVAARIATEQVIDLRTSLRYLGVPILESHMFGDNASVITSSTVPHSVLNKRHNALSYHRVREAIAAKILRFHHCRGENNPADLLSKHWAFGKVHNLIRLLFQWKGTPGNPSIDPTKAPA